MGERGTGLVGRFLSLARRDPGAVAMLGPDGMPLARRRDLAAAALELAGRLTPLVGGPAVLSLPNSPDLVSALIALRLVGAPVALVDAAAPPEELRGCAAAVGASLVICRAGHLPADAVPLAGGPIAIGRIERGGAVALPAGTEVLKLTSGSGGLPKAVAVTERQLVADTVQILRTMKVAAADVTLAAIPMTHSYGLGSCLVPLLLTGMPLALPSCALPAALADTLEKAGVAHFPAVPAMVRALTGLGGLPTLGKLRVCLTAGALLKPADAAAFHAATGRKVHVFYGSSECGGITFDRTDAPAHEDGAVGTAMERVTVEVVDGDGMPLPPGEEGRVRVRSRAAALAVVPVPEEPGTLAPGVFLTGDSGRLDGDGRLVLTGRVADLINVAGKKVHPDEVRRVIEAIPGVDSVVVAGIPDRHRGDVVAAVVAVRDGAPLTVPAILRACRERLAPHKIPRRVVLVDELPVSERGKLRRDVVLELLRAR